MTLTRYTPHTITTVEGIIQDLANIRSAGYALDNEEKNLGMRCIAAPVFDYNREVVAGISVSGPVSRLTMENAVDLAQHVMHAAAELTSAIGGTTS
jgi:IclR family acetate operon transcriptional repressor